MAKKDLYTVDRVSDEPLRYTVSKYSSTLSLETAYSVERVRGRFTCNCMAGERGLHTCRHREMIDVFQDGFPGQQKPVFNLGCLYSYDKKKWEPRTLGKQEPALEDDREPEEEI
jgi:hypothetical protein